MRRLSLLAVALLAVRVALWDPIHLPYGSIDRDKFDYIIVGMC